MAELADAQDLGSCVNSCGFESHFRHHEAIPQYNLFLQNTKVSDGVFLLITDFSIFLSWQQYYSRAIYGKLSFLLKLVFNSSIHKYVYWN